MRYAPPSSHMRDFFLIQHCKYLNYFVFLLAHFNSFFKNYLFLKFINKCQKDILRCVPPSSHVFDFLKRIFVPFLWLVFKCLKATEPLQGGWLLFSTKFSEMPGTHFINLRKMEGWVDFGVAQ